MAVHCVKNREVEEHCDWNSRPFSSENSRRKTSASQSCLPNYSQRLLTQLSAVATAVRRWSCPAKEKQSGRCPDWSAKSKASPVTKASLCFAMLGCQKKATSLDDEANSHGFEVQGDRDKQSDLVPLLLGAFWPTPRLQSKHTFVFKMSKNS